MTSVQIVVDTHVSFLSRERSTASDMRNEVSEILRIDDITQLENRREFGEFFLGKSVQVSKVTSLPDLYTPYALGAAINLTAET